MIAILLEYFVITSALVGCHSVVISTNNFRFARKHVSKPASFGDTEVVVLLEELPCLPRGASLSLRKLYRKFMPAEHAEYT